MQRTSAADLSARSSRHSIQWRCLSQARIEHRSRPLASLRAVQDRSLLWDDARQERDLRSWLGGRRATPSYRAEFSSMADDYARYALSQRAAFEATHPAVLA